MARKLPPHATIRARPTYRRLELSAEAQVSAEAEVIAAQEVERILTRLDAEIPEAQKRMDELLARLRATRILGAA